MQPAVIGRGETKAGQHRRERRGAWMSSKQIAQAAMRGRRVTFRFLHTQPAHEVTGYVCGQDDYHWLVATVLPPELRTEDTVIHLSLVHKTADLIGLAPRSSLQQEDQIVQDALARVGRDFWSWCERTYSGRSGDSRPTP